MGEDLNEDFVRVCAFQTEREEEEEAKIITCDLGKYECSPETCPIYQSWKTLEKLLAFRQGRDLGMNL